MLHIAIADDHTLIRQGIISILEAMDGLRVTIEAGNGQELIKLLESTPCDPDVCILDIQMPVMNGFDTLAELKRRWPRMGVLVLTTFENEYYFLKMILGGANGYLLKNCDPAELRAALITIHQSGMYYRDASTRSFIRAIQRNEVALPHLTAIEQAVLKWCCSDLSFAEIAHQMSITQKSFEGHRVSLYRKLNVKGRTGLVKIAIELGYIQLNTMRRDGIDFFE